MRRSTSVLVLLAIVATAQWAPARQRDAVPDNRSIDELVECLGAESPIQRLNAAKALGEKGPEAIGAILRSLDDDDWRVRRGGTDALAAMETPDTKAIGRLIRLAKDENGWVRDGVAIALGKFGDDAAPAAEVLAGLCADEESWVRYSAIGSLKSVTKDPEILLPAAVALIRVPDTCWRARGTAVGLLGQYGEGYKPATAALFHLMEHPSEGMWCSIPSAVDVLLKLGTAPEAVQRAILKLGRRDEWSYRRLAASLAVKHMAESKSTLPLLKDLAENDSHRKVRMAAAQALKDLEQSDSKK
ncbi:MAG: HEAT repeat domain-containing protein [Thermoguttaceae bacterium]